MLTQGRLKSILLVLAACAFAAVDLACGGSGPEPGRDSDIQRVVVIHFDATRTDDLGCYGGIAQTPTVDALAAKGMRYTNAVAPIPETSPSVASFLTGKLANSTGVYGCGHRLHDEFDTLPELMQEAGFVTAGIVSNANLFPLRKNEKGQVTGFDQGFDVYECISAYKNDDESIKYSCHRVTEAAIKFVDEHADDPFFLWAFYLDPHGSYAPPPPYDTMYRDNPALLARLAKWESDADLPQNPLERTAAHLGEVTHCDEWLGKLIARLEQLPGKTLYIFTADHGEGLGEHGYWFKHGHNVHSPNVDVPLILRCDGLVPVGVSDALTANVDLVPTILDLAGVSGDSAQVDGRSLLTTFDNPSPWPERVVPLQARLGWRGVAGHTHRFQVQVDPNTNEVKQRLLYDHAKDPLETTNIIDQSPVQAAALEEFVTLWFSPEKDWRKAEDLSDNPEMAERLRALGYLE